MTDAWKEWLEELARQYERGARTEKQARILRAAMEVFAEKGYAAASTSEIAQRAGVAEGTIFRHYKSKKDLLFSIVAPFVAHLIEPFVLRDFVPVLEKEYANTEEFLRTLLDNRIAFAQKNLPVIRILLQEVPFHPDLREQFLNRVAPRVLERFIRIVERYQDKGEIVAWPSLTVIRLAASTLFGYLITRFFLQPEGWDDEKEKEATIRFLLKGLQPEPKEEAPGP
ncbi:MAG: TetR family transcriptional regulator [Thermobacillus sp. ZCTH02-B1]|uniref:TetR/AcrR family transcriptional regulator n=1 Tax=Thermobacillus sp. ZCTH02-B1 TaxID=1858795 RepID=UPI000B5591DB|nr:TetR/AcrR family transcriptional regulator [Thermobacillus sp. ZCTH02-B1]OUM94309.1 MAG: TetR family transcriptional regulator [Thermobacillus sp. ZCTH02-B1]